MRKSVKTSYKMKFFNNKDENIQTTKRERERESLQVLLRVDHCLADGLRLVKAAGGFVKFEDGSTKRAPDLMIGRSD